MSKFQKEILILAFIAACYVIGLVSLIIKLEDVLW